MSSRCDRPTAMETEYAGTPRSALCVPSIGSRTRVASPAVDEAGLFAQHVEAGLLVLEDPKDRGLGHPVDPRAGCAVGPAAHDLGGVLDELRDRMLDGLGELEEKLLHSRPTAFLHIELTPIARGPIIGGLSSRSNAVCIPRMAGRNRLGGCGVQPCMVWPARSRFSGRLRGVLHRIPDRRVRPDFRLGPRKAGPWMVAFGSDPQCSSDRTRVRPRTEKTPVMGLSEDCVSPVNRRYAYIEVPT